MIVKVLSSGGKLVLIKSVLYAIPLYYISLVEPPKSVMRYLANILASFFWSDNEGGHKCQWISWSKICFRYEEGGLGIRKFDDMSKTFASNYGGDSEKRSLCGLIS